MHSIWTSIKTCQQPLETHKPTGRCVTPTHVPVSAHTVHPCAELPAAGVSGPSPGWFPRQALLSAGPSLQGASAQWAGARSACSLLSPGRPGPGSQPGGELPFAKLDNTGLSVRGLVLCLHVLRLAQGQVRPARQQEGKAWLQPELAGGRVGGGRAGRGPCCPLAASGSRPACLQSLWLPGQLLPLQLLLNSPSKHPLPGHVELRQDWSGPRHGHA